MSNYDDRLQDLRQQAANAEKAMRDLPNDAWPGKEPREHCMAVFAYVRVVLESSDGDLLSDHALEAIGSALTRFDEDPSAAAVNADPWSSLLIDAVALVPAARDRDVEQAVKDAAANFQRSAQHRLNALKSDFEKANGEIEELKADIPERKAEFAAAIDERGTEIKTEIESLETQFETKLTQLEAEVEAERAGLAKFRRLRPKAAVTSPRLRFP